VCFSNFSRPNSEDKKKKREEKLYEKFIVMALPIEDKK